MHIECAHPCPTDESTAESGTRSAATDPIKRITSVRIEQRQYRMLWK